MSNPVQHPEHLRPVHPDQPVILLADDEISVRNFAQIILEEEGYLVLTAENGDAALSVSRNYPGKIHFLLTDVVMPKMGGLELSSRIAVERPGICIVLMSGHSFAENIDQTFPFVQKPFHPQKLKDVMKALIPVCKR